CARNGNDYDGYYYALDYW
nr:immunoglobulin heavy chain junction region [Mus musculus]MBK4185952.1 immunoglobulin heavy chain junction region [Mus musculus]